MKGDIRAQYRWTDAWLLAAIAEASKNEPAPLWKIIAVGESLNHALFTDEEIESGLVRLTRGGWIADYKGQFSVTHRFNRLNLRIKSWESIRRLEKLLDAEPWYKNEPMPHPANNLKYPGITREVLYKANKEYEKYAKAEWRKLKPLLEKEKQL